MTRVPPMTKNYGNQSYELDPHRLRTRHQNALYTRQDDIPLHRIDSVRLDMEPDVWAILATAAAALAGLALLLTPLAPMGAVLLAASVLPALLGRCAVLKVKTAGRRGLRMYFDPEQSRDARRWADALSGKRSWAVDPPKEMPMWAWLARGRT